MYQVEEVDGTPLDFLNAGRSMSKRLSADAQGLEQLCQAGGSLLGNSRAGNQMEDPLS